MKRDKSPLRPHPGRQEKCARIDPLPAIQRVQRTVLMMTQFGAYAHRHIHLSGLLVATRLTPTRAPHPLASSTRSTGWTTCDRGGRVPLISTVTDAFDLADHVKKPNGAGNQPTTPAGLRPRPLAPDNADKFSSENPSERKHGNAPEETAMAAIRALTDGHRPFRQRMTSLPLATMPG